MKNFLEWLTLAFGVLGSILSYFIGDMTPALYTLLMFMCIDYLTGIINAIVFHKSNKTTTGTYDSKIGFKGLIRKCGIILMIIIAFQLDKILGFNYVKDGVTFAFLFNELVSIIENLGLMGVKIPDIIKNTLNVLKQKGDVPNAENNDPD